VHTVEEGVDQWSVHLPVLLNGQSACSDFFDDFSNPARGWYTGDDGDGRIEYRDDEYRVLVKPADFYWLLGSPACDQTNYSVEADARWSGETGASYGLVFGLQGDFEQLYTFEVNSDFQDFTLYRFGGGSWTTIVPATPSAAIHAGTETNHLKVTRNGKTQVLHGPVHKNVANVQEMMNLRHFLEHSGNSGGGL
jgi:hypothetical protein